MSSHVTLKVLSGPNLGAEIELEAGRTFAVGSAEDNDLVLADSTVAPHHAKISVSDSGAVRIESVDAAFALAGKISSQPSADLSAFQVFTIGTTHMATGPVGETWPPIRLPSLRQIGGGAPKPAPQANSGGTQKKRRPSPWIAAAAGLCVLGTLASVWIFSRPGKIPPFVEPGVIAAGTPSNGAQSTLEALARRTILAADPAASVEATYRDGRPRFTIYTATGTEADTIRKAINGLPEPVTAKLVIRSELERSVKIFLDANRLTTLKFTINPPATLQWSGFLKSRSQWETVLQALKNDLPSVTEHSESIVFGDDLVSALQALIAESPLSGAIRATLKDGGIELTGSVPPSQSYELETLVAGLEAHIGGKIPLIDSVDQKQSPEAANPDLNLGSPIVSVNLEGIPYALLANGLKLFEGARLSDGSVLEKISANSITFSREGTTRNLALNFSDDLVGLNTP